MLISVYIKNIAVIDELSVDFTDGFNVLTGETGAGKSIIIDSLNMVLGQRTSREIIRGGQQKAVVQALFVIKNDEVLKQLANLGIEAEDGNILFYRDLSPDGRGVCRINGMMATAGMVRDASQLIINIHGQHDNQALLITANHIEFLDRYARLDGQRNTYKQIYETVKDLERQINALKVDEDEKQREIELLTFQIEEIEQAKPKADEYEKLIKRRDYLWASNKIAAALEQARCLLYAGGDNSPPAHDIISSVLNDLAEVSSFDERLLCFYEALNTISIDLDDLTHQIRDYADSADFNPDELEKIEHRLDVISRLKHKYKADIPQIIEYCKQFKTRLDEINSSSENIQKLKAEHKSGMERLEGLASELTKRRKAAARDLEQSIMAQLRELDMAKVQFEVDFSDCIFNEKGADSVEFLISANAGQPPRALSKIASGGEMSRIMLAIKTILADADSVGTLIFDEIDTGISGRAAFKAARKLHGLSFGKQIICITHLAQIACMAKSHFLIEKISKQNETKTTLRLLSRGEREHEIARITSGARITETALKNAAEMLELADGAKSK